MKFLLFSDLHFAPGSYMGSTWETLQQIQHSAEENDCEFILHAGDFCHGAKNTEIMDYIKVYNDFHIPSYHALGNHDTDNATYEDMLRYYHMPNGYYYFDHGGYRMIICDPNYFFDEGNYIHYSMCNYIAMHEKYGYYDSYMPPEQLAWLERTIDESPYPCVLISHESFEREADGVVNASEVQRIVREANRKKAHQVFLCINGHNHRDNIRILDNVCYWEVNAVSYEALAQPHSLYPEEICRKWSCVHGTLVYEDPLYAIVTLEGTTITIKGRETTFFMGITHEMTNDPLCDPAGRPARTTIQSAKITMG